MDMTVEEYRQKFINLFGQFAEEHGPLKEVRITDDTKSHWNQVQYGAKWISCTVLFYE